MTANNARLCIAQGPVRLQLLKENHDCISGTSGKRQDLFKTLQILLLARYEQLSEGFCQVLRLLSASERWSNQWRLNTVSPSSLTTLGRH